ncbi:MAG: FAD-dependent oxidoreductase, partial [Calditrichia bacterium]|nr:FAD-dependent oxidoreductase [Calditrichia bacterium]
VLDKEIEGITGLGVNIHTQKRLGENFTIDSLTKDGYKSVFLALGAQASTHIAIEGEDLDNVLSGIDFLAKVEKGTMTKLHGTVAVIGGGNTAIDAARTSLRMGADIVMIIYRRTIKEMPANQEEIVAAQHEGVDVKFLNNPNKYLGKDGKVSGVECIKMELGEPDDSGRRRPVPVKDSEFNVEVDYVIEAIGQKPDLSSVSTDENDPKALKLSRWKTLDVNEDTMETNIPGVFSAGDVVLGAATAVEAIGGGKKAANGIHHHITGQWIEDIKLPFVSKRDNFRELTPEDYIKEEKLPRHSRPEIEVKERITNFEEVELAFPEKDVLNEAVRCLECGCKVFFDCKLQQVATEYQADQKAFTGEFEEYEKDTRHPFIEFDMNKCILCSKCIRVCEEVVG